MQPQVLSQLTALTALSIKVEQTVIDESDDDEEEEFDVWREGDTLKLPNLKKLHLTCYWGRHLVLDCPQLTSLSFRDGNPHGPVSLQAPLKELVAISYPGFIMHPGFPLSNFLDMVSLTIACHIDQEEQLYRQLPLMRRLVMLKLRTMHGKLLQSLPQSLDELALDFIGVEAWDDAVIPVLQQLPELRKLKVKFSGGPPTVWQDCLATSGRSCCSRSFVPSS